MRITVKSPLVSVDLEVTEFDVTQTILMRMAKEVPGTTDNFFIPMMSEYTIYQGLVIEVDDVRKDVEAVTNPATLRSVALRYAIPYKWVLGMWFRRFDPKEKAGGTAAIFEEKIKTFKLLGTTTFSSPDAVRTEIANYQRAIENYRSSMLPQLEAYRRAYEVLGTFPPREEAPGPIEVEGVESVYQAVLGVPHEVIEIFDGLVPSERMPFAACRYRGKTFYKVFAEAQIPEAWQREAYEEDGVYFKIQLKKSSRIVVIERAHANVRWYPDHRVKVEYQLPTSNRKPKEVMEEALWEIFREPFTGELSLPLEGYGPEKQFAIKCTFTTSTPFNKYCLAYLINTVPKLSSLVFMNETVKPEPLKPRFQVFFNPHSTDLPSSTTFQITSVAGHPGRIKVRIGRCKDQPSAIALRESFVRLMGVYEDLLPLAQEFFSIFKTSETVPGDVVVEKPNRKSGKRLLALQAKDSKMFKSRYGDQVQKPYQPYIVEPKDVDELTATLGPEKIMLFEGVHYACQIPGKQKKAMYPGLKLNTDTKSGGYSYREDYPLLPYCVTTPQYQDGTVLSAYLKGGIEAAMKTGREEASTKKSDYVIKSGKIVGPGRLGHVHDLLAKLATSVAPGATYYRRGVLSSPDSIFHALVSVTNPKYDSMTVEKKRAAVADVKARILAEKELLFASKQETYDYYITNYSDEIASEKKYLAPEIWTTVLEYFFKVRVVLLVIDSERPEGDFMERRSTRAFLPVAYPADRPVVVVMAVESLGTSWPYQCEVLVRADPEGNNQVALFENDALADTLAKFSLGANKVFMISPSPEGDVVEYPRSVA